jgi:hypothetical protein
MAPCGRPFDGLRDQGRGLGSGNNCLKPKSFLALVIPICQLSFAMKTPPIQQKQVADSQQSSSGLESEGKALAPPAFQLMASAGSDAPPVQRQVNGQGAAPLQLKPDGPQGGGGGQHTPAKVLTITNGNSMLRSGPPTFASLGTKIPQGTRVEVLEEKTVNGKTYIRVMDHDTGTELGWTTKSNSEDLDKKYAAAGASFNYHVDGLDLLVFLPKDGLKKTNVDVFMFFHGRGGDFTTTKTHTPGTNEYADNPAISAKIPDAVSKSGGIAICPQGKQFKVDIDWGNIAAGGFKKMVDTTLTRLSADLDRTDKPLTAGNVSLAGHSAGGNAMGQAALDTGATDVTLQEAGYGFTNSWKKLRDWFLLGQAPKTMRVITQNNGNRHATRTLVKDATRQDGKYVPGGTFSAAEIVSYSKQLVKEGKLPGPVTVQEFKGDGKAEAGDIVLERGFRVLRSDGSLQGSLRLYHLADEKADHWAASSQTMESTMTAGAADRAADKAAMEKQ